MVLFHHERPDGTGYYGKDADTVPIGSRVLSVAEAYDAMTTSRSRPRLAPDKALAYLQQHKGSTYDVDCVNVLADILDPRFNAIPLS